MPGRYADILHRVKMQNLCIAENLHFADDAPMGKTLHKAEVGRRLRTAIEALGITQVAAAQIMEVSPSKLGNWVRGDHYPDPWSVALFCNRYGVSADWVYRGLVSGSSSVVADALWKAEQAVPAVQTAAAAQEDETS